MATQVTARVIAPAKIWSLEIFIGLDFFFFAKIPKVVSKDCTSDQEDGDDFEYKANREFTLEKVVEQGDKVTNDSTSSNKEGDVGEPFANFRTFLFRVSCVFFGNNRKPHEEWEGDNEGCGCHADTGKVVVSVIWVQRIREPGVDKVEEQCTETPCADIETQEEKEIDKGFFGGEIWFWARNRNGKINVSEGV